MYRPNKPLAKDELRGAVMRYNRATDGMLSVAMSYVNVVMSKS
jgi:hypothetical protein